MAIPYHYHCKKHRWFLTGPDNPSHHRFREQLENPREIEERSATGLKQLHKPLSMRRSRSTETLGVIIVIAQSRSEFLRPR